MPRLLQLFAVIASLTVLAVASPAPVTAVPGPVPITASTPQHAAGVVIDTGSEVKRVCVRFSEDSISGEELLRRADVDAVFDYQAQGTGVCALCGTGCPASDCFCESETTGRYWNFSTGTGSGWQRSNVGAHRRTVRHGDVDGWAWGQAGATPPHAAFDAVCPPEPTPSPTPSQSPAQSPRATERPQQADPDPTPSPARDTGATADSQGAASPTPTPSAADESADTDRDEVREDPTEVPTAEPTAEPTGEPTDEPSADPTPEPTEEASDLARPDSVLSVEDDPRGGGWLRSLGWFGGALGAVGGLVYWRRRTTGAGSAGH